MQPAPVCASTIGAPVAVARVRAEARASGGKTRRAASRCLPSAGRRIRLETKRFDRGSQPTGWIIGKGNGGGGARGNVRNV